MVLSIWIDVSTIILNFRQEGIMLTSNQSLNIRDQCYGICAEEA